MPRTVLLPLNSCEVRASVEACKCVGRPWSWRVMALRVLVLITLLLLADAEKWPGSGDCLPCQCSSRTTSFGVMRTVNCSRRGLSSIPASLPDDLMALDLSWNVLDVQQLRLQLCKFPSLQLVSLAFADLTNLSDMLKECSSVLELNLTGNRLEQVDSTTFMGLKNLRRLLGLEVESVVARNIFKHLTNLKDLDVIFHGPALPKGLFDDLGIQSLNLVVTQAAFLPQKVFEFGQKTLNTLQLIGERVTRLEEDLLDGLCVLKKLYLVMPSVQQLPERIFHSQQLQPGDRSKVASLQEVEISGVHSLPAMLFNNLVTLQTLQLKEIGSFPQMGFLAGAINLRTLLVAGSELRSIPDGWFRQLYSLETLTLSGLQLEKLDENAFRELISLTYLDLSDNRLDEITARMLMPLSKTLETLILRGNLLTQINKDVLGKLTTLRHLDVSENRLTNVQINSFEGMTYLSFLYLNNNRLTSLPQDLFRGLLQVQSLSLSENYFVEFPKAILQLNRSLMSLDMASNELKEIPVLQLCRFMYLERINIMGNSLYCDCPLLAFRQCRRISVEGQCKSPPDYLDMHLNDIEVPSSCAEEIKAKQILVQQIQVMPTTVHMPERTGKPESIQQNFSVISSTVESVQDASSIQFTQTLTIVRNLFPETLTNQSKNENDTVLDSLEVAEVESYKSSNIQSARSNEQDTGDLKKESPISTKENQVESNTETAKNPIKANRETTENPVESNRETTENPIEANRETAENPIESTRETAENPTAANRETAENLTAANRETAENPIEANRETAENPIAANRETAENPIAANRETAENPIAANRETAENPIAANRETAENLTEANRETTENPIKSSMEMPENPIESNRETIDSTLQTNTMDSSRQPNGEDVESKDQTSAGSSGNTSTQTTARLFPEDLMETSKTAKTPGLVEEGDLPDKEQKGERLESVKLDNETAHDQMIADSPGQGNTTPTPSFDDLTKTFLKEQFSESSAQSVPTLQGPYANTNPSEEPVQTGGEENPRLVGEENLGEKKDLPLGTTASVNSSTMLLDFEDFVKNDMKGSNASAPFSVIYADEFPFEPAHNKSFEGPNGEEMGNDTKDGEGSERATFNFIISAVVTLSLTGCVVLGVICVRQWQQKGSYRLREDAELSNLDIEEGAAIFPKEKVEVV